MKIRLLALLVAAAPALGHAQRIDGVVQPTGDAAAGEGARMVETNPAGLGFGPSFELHYLYADSDLDRPDEGHAAFIGLGVLDPYHTALGVQFLELPRDAAGRDPGVPVKVSWGHALRLGEAFSLGFTWHSFVADDAPAIDGHDTWDVGFQVRPWRWVATGLSITDITTPLRGGEPVDRGYEVALAVRPGTERLTLTGTARFEEDDADDPRLGGQLRLRLFSRFALHARYDTDVIDDERTHRLLVGLADIGRFGLGAYAYAPDLADDDGLSGFAVSARFQSEVPAYPALLPRTTVVEVSLGSAEEYGPGGFLFPAPPKTPFLDTLLTLRALERRDDVSAVLLSMGEADPGWAQVEELRDAVTRLRDAGKKVYVWLPVGDTRGYVVASAADRIYTAPSGGLLLTGLRAEMMYFGDLLKKLGVEAQFVAMKDFKTAPESFTRDGPSPAALRMEDALLDDLFGRLVARVAQGRGWTEDKVRALIDGAPYTAQAAEKAGLVDGVIHYDQFEDVFREAFGKRVRFVDARRLLAAEDPRWGPLPTIGVLYAVGTITDGESVVNPLTGAASTGADTFVKATRALREDRRVQAVVLRVDSPGGSVTAADAMWRELTRLAEEKPLIVSMGDIAASGGYYIAAPAREILASRDTITGSIGVFTGKFDLSGLGEWAGVDVRVFKRGERADLLSSFTRWDEDDIARVRDAMQSLYDLFVSRVAEGRENLDAEAVEPLARGRVWTGAQAQACGLVDRPAGLLTAIDLAALEAGLGEGDYALRILPTTSGFGGLPSTPVMSHLDRLARLFVPIAELPRLPAAIRHILSLPLFSFESGAPLALLPYELRLE